MPTISINQFVAGDFDNIFDSAFFAASDGSFALGVNEGDSTSTFISAFNTEDPDRVTEFTGTGFSFDPVTGAPTGGTVETITFKFNGVTQATITGLSIPLVDLAAALVAAGDGDETLLDALFAPFAIDYSAATAPGGVFVDIASDLGDTYVGSSSGDTIIGGAGEDTLFGGDGDDLFDGGNGGDTITPGANDGFDVMRASLGNDTYDFTGADGSEFFFYRIDYGTLGGNVTATLGSTSGTVDKTVDGSTDTLLNIDLAAVGGFELKLGGGDDTVTASLTTDAFLQIIVQGGSDDITGGDGFERIRVQTDFSDADAAGATINVTSSGASRGEMTGTLTDDFGGTVTFTNVDEIRGSDDDDTFFGGAGVDFFITDEGDDSVDGGAGFDRLRYDRPGVTAIDADLAAGTVAKTWNGTDYTDQVANVEWLRGSSGADSMAGSDADERFQGRDGGDTLFGGGGQDDLQGESGNDTVFGGAGDDVLDGGNGDDTIFGGDNDGFDVLLASPGDDIYDFVGADADDDNFYRVDYRFLGGDLMVDLGATSGTVAKSGDGSTDTLLNLDKVSGVNGGLEIRLTSGTNTLTSAIGADRFLQIITVGGTDDITGGGDGFERIRAFTDFDDPDTAGITVTVTSSGADFGEMTGSMTDDFGGMITFTDIDEIRGSNDDDTFLGAAGVDFFITDEGNDSVDGGAGVDRLSYNRFGVTEVLVDLAAGTVTKTWNGNVYTDTVANVEIIRGSDGEDSISGSAADETLAGRGGDDDIFGLGGDDRLFGGGGNDVVLGGGGADELSGDGGNDRIDGAEDGDTLFGGFGDDTLNAGNGDDILDGGGGANTLRGQGGNDTITGGDDGEMIAAGIGADTVEAGGGADEVLGQGDADTIDGGAGEDVLRGGSGNDVVFGGADDDEIFGQGNNDMLFGGSGNDTITAAAGADTIYGGDGDDRLFGGTAGDRLTGGAGNDFMNGGAQADRFFFDLGHDSDTVSGFQDDLDTLVFTEALVGGALTPQEVLDAFATQVGASVEFDFGNGDTLRVTNVTLADLVDDIMVD